MLCQHRARAPLTQLVRAMNLHTRSFVLAPLSPATVGFVFFGIKNASLDIAGTAFIFIAFCGYVSELLFVIPALRFAQRRAWIGFPALVSIGVGSALLLTVLASVLLRGGRGEVTWLQGFLNLWSVSVPAGAIYGASLWWFLRRAP